MTLHTDRIGTSVKNFRSDDAYIFTVAARERMRQETLSKRFDGKPPKKSLFQRLKFNLVRFVKFMIPQRKRSMLKRLLGM
jgi:hypothetical protein